MKHRHHRRFARVGSARRETQSSWVPARLIGSGRIPRSSRSWRYTAPPPRNQTSQPPLGFTPAPSVFTFVSGVTFPASHHTTSTATCCCDRPVPDPGPVALSEGREVAAWRHRPTACTTQPAPRHRLRDLRLEGTLTWSMKATDALAQARGPHQLCGGLVALLCRVGTDALPRPRVNATLFLCQPPGSGECGSMSDLSGCRFRIWRPMKTALTSHVPGQTYINLVSSARRRPPRSLFPEGASGGHASAGPDARVQRSLVIYHETDSGNRTRTVLPERLRMGCRPRPSTVGRECSALSLVTSWALSELPPGAPSPRGQCPLPSHLGLARYRGSVAPIAWGRAGLPREAQQALQTPALIPRAAPTH